MKTKNNIPEVPFIKWNKKLMIKVLFCAGIILIFILQVASIITEVIIFKQLNFYFEKNIEILFWDKYRGGHRLLEGQAEFKNNNCTFKNCYITHYFKSLSGDNLRKFDAIVFDVHSLRELNNTFLTMHRAEHQKYIFHSLESNINHPVCNIEFDDFFNWTWTYKTNSDILHSYFNIFDENNNRVGPKVNISWVQNIKHDNIQKINVTTKSKAIAWISYKSKCDNILYVNNLRKELKGYNLSIDVFGPCGDKNCKNNRLNECYNELEKDYYFALNFEDVNTEDFVTHKLLKILQYGTIPIVAGSIHYERFMPPGAFINSRIFNIKKLAAVIDYLIKNTKYYEYFFDWHSHYYYRGSHGSYICDLCSKMNHKSFKDFSVYTYFRYWWNKNYRKVCR